MPNYQRKNQNIEWKESWRDEYIKTMCGFANASGGVLEIGRRDNGEIVGSGNTKKLLEDLPNKIRSATGVIPAIDLLESDEDLFTSHTSKPYNSLIAGAFFRSGQIEAWGRGIESCKSWGKQEPFYRIRSNEVMIGFNTDVGIVKNIVENVAMNEVQAKILELMCNNPKTTAKAIAKEIGIAQSNVQVHIQAL